MPPAGITLPGAFDDIIFDRFVLNNGQVYPVYAPGGTMAATSSDGQVFINTTYNENCPVGLGTTGSYFTFRSINTSIKKGLTGNTNPSYINFVTGDGVTLYSNAVVSLTSGITSSYYIKGRVDSFATLAAYYSPAYYNSFAQVYAENLTIAIAQFASLDTINLYPTSIITGRLTHNDGSVNIQRPFGITCEYNISGIINPSINVMQKPVLNLIADVVTGATGASTARTKFESLKMSSSQANWDNPVSTPVVNVYHTCGITYLSQRSGEINFMVPYGVTATVESGEFIVGYGSKITSNASNVFFGNGGNGQEFVIDNLDQPYTKIPNINLVGAYDIYANPASLT
jgi:hypothetical protein